MNDRLSHTETGKWHRYPELAAAGLWTTPSDLARLVLEIQAAWNGSSHKVLSSGTTRAMLAPQIIPTQGLGWRLAGQERSCRLEHSGDTEGFACAVVGYLDRGQGAVVMTNGPQGARLVSEILRAIAREYDWPDYLPKETKVVAVPENLLVRHAGRYALDIAPDILIDISVHQDSLLATVIQPTGTDHRHLLAESPDLFIDQESGVEFTFIPESPDRPRCLVIRQENEEYRATFVR